MKLNDSRLRRHFTVTNTARFLRDHIEQAYRIILWILHIARVEQPQIREIQPINMLFIFVEILLQMFADSLMEIKIGLTQSQLQINHAHFGHILDMVLPKFTVLSLHKFSNWPEDFESF